MQRRVAFERFLARLFFSVDERWVFKGGYTLELRLGGRARTTLDIDPNVPPPPYENLLSVLQKAAERDLGDHFSFTLRKAKHDLHGSPLGGERFQVEALLGKPYTSFVLDVGQGDITSSPPERMTGQLDLRFAGLEPTPVWVYPTNDHFAEKLHAYTKPRDNPSRVEDLLDMVLMIDEDLVTLSPTLRGAVEKTFERYDTHSLPAAFPYHSRRGKKTLKWTLKLKGSNHSRYYLLFDLRLMLQIHDQNLERTIRRKWPLNLLQLGLSQSNVA